MIPMIPLGTYSLVDHEVTSLVLAFPAMGTVTLRKLAAGSTERAVVQGLNITNQWVLGPGAQIRIRQLEQHHLAWVFDTTITQPILDVQAVAGLPCDVSLWAILE